jgi:hypothetical protein
MPLPPTREASPAPPRRNAQARNGNTRQGVIEAVDEANGVVLARFEHEGHIAAGTPVSILHRALFGEVRISGRVDEWNGGYAIVRPFESDQLSRLAPGDAATLYIPRPVRVPRRQSAQ